MAPPKLQSERSVEGPVHPYPDIFELEIRNFSDHMQRILTEFACPLISDGIRIHSRETGPTSCAAILVYCLVRNWTRFGFGSIRIYRPGLFFFHSAEPPDAYGRKLYPQIKKKLRPFKNIRVEKA